MASTTVTTGDAVAFEPTEAGLDAAVGLLEERLGGDHDGALRERRARALRRYQTLALPGTRPGRGWRHDYDKLDFAGLRWTTGDIVVPTTRLSGGAVPSDAEADVPALATENAAGLVHIGPRVVRQANRQALPDGVIVASMYAAPRSAEGAARDHALDAAVATDRFAALAEAFENCSAFVYVPAGVVVEKPIQLVFATAEGSNDAVFPKIVVVLGERARATVIERHIGSADAFVCGNAVLTAQAGAELDYVAVQQSGETARVFMHRTAECKPNATARLHLAELGGTLVRSVVEIDLAGEGARGETSALFFNTGFQHVDLSTTTTHVVGNTGSDTVVRSAASDRGQGRFVGNIAIRPAAHGADASLRDDALLLSKRAHIDSVPALEIAANDVKAFHGATVGSLDEEALFYASSRGIARPDAVRMVALAFFEPAIARFPGDALRDEVRTALDHKIDAATEIDA